ncbi:Sec1p NDAI_0J00830 [Naumovozyma dairenensis CBS 421]|uniref:Uncharacterized protein n=1 Tax=Naumovozyma dairenensis (strain ATCC 10597 / BCRC 20456 / CBS 421 / NBRC 0211 / NRRL Y-12639) TaxID=1071378 RepID=G0WGP7_NAUDC|nr:hypothetical protein NDAI_0J00830 [Naumovozyma dairenensis CBS 421]CCD26975.1 hypothetical protein NDAI_0J00830 [Naumovozyma dairenensis CBS 421]
MSNLIDLQRNYLIDLLVNIQTNHNIKFLVIDEYAENIINFLFQNPKELLTYVTTVDRIDSPKRKGQHDVDVIYLLKPTKFNINCIDADFQSRPSKYRKAHIRFFPTFERYLINFFQSKRYIQERLSTMDEARIAFIPKEKQFFQTLDIDKPLQLFFNKNCTDLIEKNIQKTIKSLLNICIITGEYPIIRYSEPSEEQMTLTPPTKLAGKLAKEFQLVLDSYARDHEDFPPQSDRPRSIMIITDRTLDPFSPILHDFNYQAMVYDVIQDVDPRTDVYHYKAENELGEFEEKSSKLIDIQDPDWVELKYQHIVDANDYLSGKIKEMIAKNPLLVDRQNVKNTTDLLSVVAHLKDFDEERRRLILHRTLIDSCLTINKDRRLAELAEVEQNLAGFGMDMDGEKCKHIIDTLLEVLMTKEANITDKVRYIMAYALYRGGIIEDDFVKLLAFIGVEVEHEYFKHFMILFKNYELIGFKLMKDKPKDKPFKKVWFHDTIVKDPSIYTTSRYITASGNILSKVITNPLLLDELQFPYVKDKPIQLLDEEEKEMVGASATAYNSASLRNPRHKASWTRNNVSQKENIPRQRFFYYVLGGITYPEIKSAYDQSNFKNKDVFIGSDGIITPLAYMRSIEFLTKPREALNLKDDEKEVEKIPDFILGSESAISKPVSHVHLRSRNAPISKPQAPAMEASPEKKKKKHHKFTSFLRSKDK